MIRMLLTFRHSRLLLVWAVSPWSFELVCQWTRKHGHRHAVAVLGSGSTIFYWIHVRRWRRPDMALATAVPEDPVDFGFDYKVEAMTSGRMPLRAEQRPTADEADARCGLARCAAPAILSGSGMGLSVGKHIVSGKPVSSSPTQVSDPCRFWSIL